MSSLNLPTSLIQAISTSWWDVWSAAPFNALTSTKAERQSGGRGGEDRYLLHSTVCWGETCAALLPWELLSSLPFIQSLLSWPLQKIFDSSYCPFGGNEHLYKAKNPPKTPWRVFLSSNFLWGQIPCYRPSRFSWYTGRADIVLSQCFKLKSIFIHPCARNQVILCLSESLAWFKTNYLVSNFSIK